MQKNFFIVDIRLGSCVFRLNGESPFAFLHWFFPMSIRNIIFKKEKKTQGQNKSPLFPVASSQPLTYFPFSLNYTVPMTYFSFKENKGWVIPDYLGIQLKLNKTLKNFMDRIYRWGSAVSRLQSHYEELVYFLLISAQEITFFDRPRKDERLSGSWSHLIVLNPGPWIRNPAP